MVPAQCLSRHTAMAGPCSWQNFLARNLGPGKLDLSFHERRGGISETSLKSTWSPVSVEALLGESGGWTKTSLKDLAEVEGKGWKACEGGC